MEKLNTSDLADMSKVAEQLGKGAKTVYLGVILGCVRALMFRKNPSDETQPIVSLVGVFEGQPATGQRKPLKASVCTIQPSAIHAAIVKRCAVKLPAGQMPERGRGITVPLDNMVEFAVAVSAKSSASAIGYAYEGTADIGTVGDPLDGARKRGQAVGKKAKR